MLTKESLFFAWIKVRDNAGVAGSDGESIAEFEKNLFLNLDHLLQEIQSGKYLPKPLKRVYKKEKNKQRPLSIPCVRDRVVQTAIAQYLTPLLEPHFEEVSFAYRQGFSVQQAIQRVIAYYQEGFQWVVDADIRAYFDEVPHHALFLQLKSHLSVIPEGHQQIISTLIQQWLDCPILEHGKKQTFNQGIPQGSPLSPLLANLYLDQLDDALLAKNKKLVRFADDFLILCRNEQQAEKTLNLTGDILARLQLSLNEAKTDITNFDEGFQFLGHQFIRSMVFKTSKELPDNSSLLNIETKKTINKEGSPEAVLEEPLAEQTQMARAFQAALEQATASESEFQKLKSQSFQAEANDAVNKVDLTISSNHTDIQFDPLLRTLYLCSHDLSVSKVSQRLQIESDESTQQIAVIHIDSILVLGNAQFSTQAIRLCLKHAVEIHFANTLGRYSGRLAADNLGRCFLHQRQFELQTGMPLSNSVNDSTFSSDFCRAIVLAKLNNSLTVLRRNCRRASAPVKEVVDQSIAFIARERDKIKKSDNLPVATLRGIEGSSAKAYFALFAVLCQEHNLSWQGREQRPANDAVNAALNFLYTLLHNNMLCLVHAEGLNPYVGYLHTLKRHHAALASDLIEPFRSIVVDSLVLRLIREGKFDEIDQSQQQGSFKLPNSIIRLLIQGFEKRMNQRVVYQIPIEGSVAIQSEAQENAKKQDMRRIMSHQVRQTKAWIMGKSHKVNFYTQR